MLRLIYLTILLLLPVASHGVEQVYLEENGSYLTDSAHQLTLEQVLALDESRWEPVPSELSLGLINDTVWVRLPLSLQTRQAFDGRAILFLTNPMLNQVSLYLVEQNKLLAQTQLGDHTPIVERGIPVSDLYWQLPENWQQASHLYVRIRSDSFFQSHFLLKDVATTLLDHGQHYWMLGLFYGALLIMLFYNLFVYFQIRDVRYLYYSGYVLTAGLFHCVMDGLPYYLLSDYYPLFADRLSIYFLAFTNIFAILFIIKFLELRDKRLLRASYTLIVMFIVSMGIEIINHCHLSTLFSMFMTIVSGLSICYLTLKSWLQGNEQARYLVMAWVVLIASIPIYAMALYGVLPHNTFTLNSVRVGVVLELALISFSLAHRINLLRKERMMLQSRLNKELGQLVQERTRELEDANSKLQSLSETDSLTQLKNRAYFNKAIADEAARAKRHNASLALLLADLDHFKRINDSVGHNAGDYCLKQFARILNEQLSRTTDVACRYGGEEFVAVLPDTDLEGAITVAEKIRHTVAATRFIFEGTTIKLTVSIGVFTDTPHADWNSDDWIGKADKALYFAKGKRNCVGFINEQGQPAFADNDAG